MIPSVDMLILRLDLQVSFIIITFELIWAFLHHFTNSLGLRDCLDGDCDVVTWARLLVGNLMWPYWPSSGSCM